MVDPERLRGRVPRLSSSSRLVAVKLPLVHIIYANFWRETGTSGCKKIPASP